MNKLLASLVFLCVASVFQSTYGVAVMSVDIGSEWFKVAIVSPGVPMEIALNKESKRKTPMTISYRDKERTFGEEAQIVGLRFPKNSFSYFLDLLGKSIDNPMVELHRARFPYHDIIEDASRGTIAFRMEDNSTHTPEELLAQIFCKSREFAEISAGQKINEAVITVPAFFNQAERKAVLQAAALAEVKVLQLFSDNTAIALNYGIFRRKEINDSTHYTMFYDMGASSSIATIVGYQNVRSKEKGTNEITPQVTVLGVGYDRTLGGLEMQIRLRDYLAEEFNKLGKAKRSVRDDPRAMAKLFKEAGRVKNILSANTEHYAQIEGLIDDLDFRIQVTRQKLEELCEDVFHRVSDPIKIALDTAGLSMSLISQVVLVGAGTRMPKIQEKLTAFVKTELSKNINTDEAAALGAIYKAADLSQGFKVKKFAIKDAVLLPIQIVFDRNVDKKTKQVRKTLFGKMNTYPQKKIITFNKHKEDFGFGVQYAELDHLPKHEQQRLGSLNVSYVTLNGVAEAHKKHAQQNAESKGIRAHFSMDNSGILSLHRVELLSEKSINSEHVEEEGSDEEAAEKVEINAKEDQKPVTEELPEESSPNANQADKSNVQNETKITDEKVTNRTDKTEKKPIVTTLTEIIDHIEIRHGPLPLEGERFQKSLEKIKALNEYDLRKTRRESALNNLEAFVIDTTQKLETKEYQDVVTEEELERILKECRDILEWLYEDGFNVEAEVYDEKLSNVKKLTENVYEKVYEHRERPEALKGMVSMINGSKIFLNNMKNLSETQDIFTPVEMETLERTIRETQDYHDEVVKSVETTPLHEPIQHKVFHIANKMAALDREVKYLLNKAKSWRPKSEKVEVNDSKITPEDLPELDPNATAQSDAATEEIPTKPEDVTDDTDFRVGNETLLHDEDEIMHNETLQSESETVKIEDDSSHEEL